MKKYMSHGSPASVAASSGAGPKPGAGMLNHPGSRPGPAAEKKIRRFGSMEMPNAPAPSGARPRGMTTYDQE